MGGPIGSGVALALPVQHVVPGYRYRIERFCELHLEHHAPASPKGDLRADKVHLPHPAKALVIDRAQTIAIPIEAMPPGFQRLGIM